MAKDLTADVSGVTNKILTHEVGAGAPCLKCGDKCPGLDLHFWRKICRNCKCPQEDHAVQDSVSTRGIENIGKLLMYDRENEGSAPENHHQTSPVKTIDTSTVNKPSNEKTNVIVEQKIAANKQAHNEHSSPEKVKPSVSTVTQTESENPLHVTVNIGGKSTNLDFGNLDLDFPAPPPEAQTTNTATSPDLPPPPVDAFQMSAPTSTAVDAVTSPTLPAPPVMEKPKVEVKTETKTVQEPAKTMSIVTKDVSKPIPPKASVAVKVVPSPSSSSSSDQDELTYDWTPPTDNQKLIKEYIEALPKDKQPISGKDGAQYRRKQLMRQLPPHDQEPSACHDLTPQEKQEMDVFVTQYRKKALGVGKVDEAEKIKVCDGCKESLKVCDVYVWAERASKDKYWHPKCFSCAECKELLVDLIYFYHDEKVYCGRHYCELHKPRCAACDELIFAPEYTQAEDCYWHLKHFCCWQCDQPLGGKNYVPHDNQPVCIPCYEKSFAHKCATCNEVIAPNIEWVTFEKFHWHALPECFRCTNCSQSLVGKPCIPKDGMVFCSSKCKKEKIPQ